MLYNRPDDRDDNSIVHNQSTFSRSDSSKNHLLSGSNEKLNATVIKENDQKDSNRKFSMSQNSEENKRNSDSKDKHEADARYFEKRAPRRESKRLARSKRRAEKGNRDLPTLRKLPSSKKLKLVPSTSSRKKRILAKMQSSESKQSVCHKDRNNSTGSVAKATTLSETSMSVEKKTTDSALTKMSDDCSDIVKELEALINTAEPKLHLNDKKVNTNDVDDSNDSLNLTENDVILVQPEVPIVDLTVDSVEDISLYRNPETPVADIKVECDNSPTSPTVDNITPNPALDRELQPLNTRLSYLDCFTTIFDDTRPVNMDISPTESPTETTNKKRDRYDRRDVSKQLSFSKTVSDQTDETEKLYDIDLTANNQFGNAMENLLSTETEDLIPYVKKNLSRSKSLSDLHKNDASVTKFTSLGDLSTVKLDSSLLVSRIREKEKSVPVSVSPKQVQDDVIMVSNHYTEELYWLLCVSATCRAANDETIVKEENNSETALNNSSLDNSKVQNATNICIPSQGSNSYDKAISSDSKTIGEKPVKDIKGKRKFEKDIQRSNTVHQSSNDTFNRPKKRRRIIVPDTSSSDDDENNLTKTLKPKSLKNELPRKSKEPTQQKIKETKVKSETHCEVKPVNSTTSHTVIKPKEELKTSKKSSENKPKSTAKIVSRRSSYSFDSKHHTNYKNIDQIKRREKIKQLFGDLSDDEESLTDTGLSTEEEKTQRTSSHSAKQSHRKKDKTKEKKKLSVELNHFHPCKTSREADKVKTSNLLKKKPTKSVDSHVSNVRSKSRSTSKERVYDIVKSLTKDSSSSLRRSSVSHKKSSSKQSFGKVEDYESVAESRNVDKHTTRKSEPIREKITNKAKEHNSKTALSKRRQSAPDVPSVTPEALLSLREATEEKLPHIELQSCETFDVAKLEVPVISKIVENVCKDRGVLTEGPEVKIDCLTVKQVEMTSDDDDVVAVESDALVIDLTDEDKSPTKTTDSWSGEEGLKTLLMNPRNKGETITIYRADEGNSNTKGVEAVNISLDCNGKSTINMISNKDLQKNTAVSHISETNLPQSSAASKSPEISLPEVNMSRQSVAITTQQVLLPNNLTLAPNNQNVPSIRQPSVNVTPSQQSTSFQSAASPNTSIQKQPPPLRRNPLDLMPYHNQNLSSSGFVTDTTTEELGINDRMKIVEILTRHVYFLAHLCNVQKMYVYSLSQCLHYKNYFQTELTLFEDQIRQRLQSQSLRMYKDLMDLKIKATKNLNHTVLLIVENLTISLESKDMPKQVTKPMVFLLLWELLKFKIELYTQIPLFKLLVIYCNMVIKKIISKSSGEQEHETPSQSHHVNTNVNRSIQYSASSNTVNQQSTPQSKLVSTNQSTTKNTFVSPKPLGFRRLTPSEFASKHSQSTLKPPAAPTGLGNIRVPNPRNPLIPNSNQMPLNLTASSLTYSNSSATHNTFQPQSTPTEYNSDANTSSASTTSSDAVSPNRNFSSSSTDRPGNTAPAEPTYQAGNCHSSLLLAELLRVGKSETHSSLNKNLMVNLPFTKPLPYAPKSPSVSTKTDKLKFHINILQNHVIPPKKDLTSNVTSSAEYLRGQTKTRPNQLASSEGASSLNLTGSTKKGTLDHLYVAISKVDSQSQDMTLNNSQITKGSCPTFFQFHAFTSSVLGSMQFIPTTEDSDTVTSSIQLASPKQTHRPGTSTVSIEPTMNISPSTHAAIDIIDLTWIDDVNETDLQNDMDFVFVKQENLEGEASNPEAEQNRTVSLTFYGESHVNT